MFFSLNLFLISFMMEEGARVIYDRSGHMPTNLRVTVWNEFRHEKQEPKIAEIYPEGIHGAIAKALTEAGHEVHTATLDEPEHGLTETVLNSTDVLVWWGHMAHHEVADEVVNRVVARVHAGMGLIVLHSGHFSKVFQKLMGTSCNLRWREEDEKERLWVVDPTHPIAAGLSPYFELPQEETYGEHFDIPVPDEVVFVSWFSGGDVFRSGCTFRRGLGKIFYFRPGHETYPTYHDPNVVRVIQNAVLWARPVAGPRPTYGHAPSLEHA
ncbi:trehalose utilization protein ThuA [Alicyclobacillus hesperidum]|uniref:Trehalose utilization protein ThuA n=2 Tax=Alicyclobacillus hesperidum TaxID=89784 RepID=A0AA37U3W6_9BACL|nr:trehalose utilization protein ThuA [Alicyclobacillus hesperidum]